MTKEALRTATGTASPMAVDSRYAPAHSHTPAA